MPLTKKSFRRYLIIDACLRNKQYVWPSARDIISKIEDQLDCKISLSTFEKDLYAMKELPEPGYYAPIRYDRYHKGYYYSDQNYSIASFQLREEDIDAIELATSMLCRYRGVPVLSRFAGAIDKIMNVVNARKILNEDDFNQYVLLEEIPLTQGNEYIETLLSGIRDRKVFQMNYKTFYAHTRSEYIVHPYLLKEHQNRWYLIGLAEHADEIRTFGLDRIAGLEVIKNKSFRGMGFDPKKYFADTVGISTPVKSKAVNVELSFTKKQGQYLITQPLHYSQRKVKDTRTHLNFTFRLIINYELISRILGWGDEVKVIRPKELQNTIKRILISSAKQY